MVHVSALKFLSRVDTMFWQNNIMPRVMQNMYMPLLEKTEYSEDNSEKDWVKMQLAEAATRVKSNEIKIVVIPTESEHSIKVSMGVDNKQYSIDEMYLLLRNKFGNDKEQIAEFCKTRIAWIMQVRCAVDCADLSFEKYALLNFAYDKTSSFKDNDEFDCLLFSDYNVRNIKYDEEILNAINGSHKLYTTKSEWWLKMHNECGNSVKYFPGRGHIEAVFIDDSSLSSEDLHIFQLSKKIYPLKSIKSLRDFDISARLT